VLVEAASIAEKKRSPPRGSGGLRKEGALTGVIGMRGIGEASSRHSLSGSSATELVEGRGSLSTAFALSARTGEP
jgi:hypothetical protein